jgi:hypothetical protein
MTGLSHDQVETMLAVSLDRYRTLKAKEQELKVAIQECRAQPILQQLNDE